MKLTRFRLLKVTFLQIKQRQGSTTTSMKKYSQVKGLCFLQKISQETSPSTLKEKRKRQTKGYNSQPS